MFKGAWDLNYYHLHLLNGQNVFARRRLAAEHGLKFGFVVKPKLTSSEVRYFLGTHEPLEKNRVTFTGEEVIKREIINIRDKKEDFRKLNQFFTPLVNPNNYQKWM